MNGTLLLCRAAALLILAFLAAPALAEDDGKGWAAPFGGRFNANFTVASEYAQYGVSNTQLQPAYQAGLDYRTPHLLSGGPTEPVAWLYGSVWGSNVDFYGVGPGVELQLMGGGKMLVLDKRMKLDLSWTQHTFPGLPSSFQLAYGELGLDVDYDFGWLQVGGRVRYSPNNSGGSGPTWNKRLRLTVPLDFLKTLADGVSFHAYGTLGNYWITDPPRFGVDRNEYWYWQLGVVTTVWGLDVNLAYTATNVPPAGCFNTADCSGRFLAAITKAF